MKNDASPHGLPSWVQQSIGGGIVTGSPVALRLSLANATPQGYVDAEVHDYARPCAADFAWRPPVRLQLRARASHPVAPPDVTNPDPAYLLGTAGFGFWNAPFVVAHLSTRLPDAVWFFYGGPPHRLSLVPDVPGWGWKAQMVHAHRWGAVAAGLPTLGAVAWARVSGDTRSAARWVQRMSGARETMLMPALTAWHDYRLDWLPDHADFFVDGLPVAHLDHPPRGPLGFIAWIDNQYAVVTPRGEFRSGIVATGEQWLELADVTITQIA